MANCNSCDKKLWRPTISGLCDSCQQQQIENNTAAEAKKEALRQEAVSKALKSLIITTETAHNLPIDARLGIVTGQCVYGLNVIKDMLAGARDIVGGRSNTMQSAIRDTQAEALEEMSLQAADLGADAIVGVSFTHTQMGSGGSGNMIAVIATGTAVTLLDKPNTH